MGSCQGEGEDVGDEVKGQGSPCPTDVPGVSQGTHSPCCRGFAGRSAPARPWSSAERGKRAGRVAGWPCLWAAQQGHGATDLPVEQTLRGKQRPHPAVTSWAQPAQSSPLCQGPGDKPWLAQGNTHRAQSSPCLATLLPHAQDCRSGQQLRLHPLGTQAWQCPVPAS